MPASVSRQVAGSPAEVALPSTPAVTAAVTDTSSSTSRDDRDVVHVRGGPHDGRVLGGEVELLADAVVVRLHAGFRDDTMSIDVSRALAALVIDQPAHVLRPSAMPDGGADHVMSPLELRDEIPAGSAQFEERFGTQALPTVCLDLCHGQSNPNRSRWRPCRSNQSASCW